MKHTKKITILHSNDLHGDFLAEQVDEKLVGGVSMLSGYIEKVRAEEPNTIYAIAGDMFRGSVIDSEYKGLSTIEIMNALAPDIVTIGNHEVDYGIAHLLFIEKCARFPIINANLYIKNTPTRLFTPYKILRVDGMNILFIGIITQDVINQTKSESLVGSFVDTAAAAAEFRHGDLKNSSGVIGHTSYQRSIEDNLEIRSLGGFDAVHDLSEALGDLRLQESFQGIRQISHTILCTLQTLEQFQILVYTCLIKTVLQKLSFHAFQTDLVHLVQSDKYAVIGLFGESAISSHCLEDTALIDTDLEILESQLTQCGGRCKDQFDLC